MMTPVYKVGGDSYVEVAPGELAHQREFYGLSTDTKPTGGVRNAEIYYEMDTGKVFLFDDTNSQWLEQ